MTSNATIKRHARILARRLDAPYSEARRRRLVFEANCQSVTLNTHCRSCDSGMGHPCVAVHRLAGQLERSDQALAIPHKPRWDDWVLAGRPGGQPLHTEKGGVSE